MKKIETLTLIIGILIISLIQSCTNDELIDHQKRENKDNQNESEWKYTKELTLKNGQNTAFIMICSNFEDSLDNYLNKIDINLEVFTEEQNITNTSDFTTNNKNQVNIEQFDIREPSVVIIHEGNNFLPEVVSSKITFKPKALKSYGPIPIAAHESWTKFIGIITEDDGGLTLMVTFHHKQNIMSSWTQIQTNSITTRPGYNQYYWPFDTYKNRMQIYRHWDDTVYPSYSVYSTVSDFQNEGTNCVMGSYDGANCYVGSAPSGTNAFIYNDKFFYTALNGNQCPLPGSTFDGVHCMLTDIVDNASPYIYNNRWYVQPYIESSLLGKEE